jgi:hypothetical protein
MNGARAVRADKVSSVSLGLGDPISAVRLNLSLGHGHHWGVVMRPPSSQGREMSSAATWRASDPSHRSTARRAHFAGQTAPVRPKTGLKPPEERAADGRFPSAKCTISKHYNGFSFRPHGRLQGSDSVATFSRVSVVPTMA